MFSMSLAVQSSDLVIDSFVYPTQAAAQAAWPNYSAGQAVTLATDAQTMALGYVYTSNTRGYWDRTVSLDLSASTQITVKLKATRSPIPVSIHFITTGGGGYVKYFNITDKWETYVFPISSFSVDGTVTGWNNVTKVRISCWKPSDTSPATVYAANLGADNLVIDSFTYATPAAAQAAWPAYLDGLAAVPVTVLSLHNNFTSSTTRGYWDRTVNLDLSAYSVTAVRMKSTRPCMSVSFHFITTGGGAYAKYFYVTDQWATYVFPLGSFASEGTVTGWNNVTKVRISCWKGEDSSPATACVSDLIASNYKNLLPNSGFEFTTSEAMPDYWGSGSWATYAEQWVINMDSWRTNWGVDRTVRHTGTNSLRIVKSALLPSEERYVAATLAPVALNHTYTMSAWLRSDQSSLPVTLDAIGCTPATTASVTTPSTANTWQRYSLTFTPTASVSGVRCYIYPTANGTLWVDDVQLEDGTTPTTWYSSLIDRDIGKAVHKTVSSISDYAITPGGSSVSVNIDGNGRFLVDGQPFIPFGIAWSSPTLPSAAILEHVAKAGFNTICLCPQGQLLTNVNTCLDNARNNGLKVIIYWMNYNSVPASDVQTWINNLKSHPAIIMWDVYDEPDTVAQWTDANAKYAIAKAADPSRPAMVNGACHNENISTDWNSDVLSMDYYPVGNDPIYLVPCDVFSGSAMSNLGNKVEMMHQVALAAGKPTWNFLQSAGNAYYICREPTGAEAECMTYLSIIHGSRGMWYFQNMPRTVEQWNEMRILSGEIKTLTPILYSTDTAPAVSVNSSSIHLLSKRYNGQNYVIAVNESPFPVTAAMTISGADGWVMFENRLVFSSGGTLTDTFAGYQRHVYCIDDTKLHLKLDESAGATTASDCSGNGNNGALTNMDSSTDWVAGKIGNALDFDGVNDYVSCPDNSSLQLTGDLTLSFWIKPTSVGTRRQNPLDKSYSGEFALNIETSGQLSYYHHRTASPYYWCYYTTNMSIQSSVWQHIVVTRDATTRIVKFHYNGVLTDTSPDYTTAALPVASASPVLIGKGYSNCFTGQMDDMRIYARVLSQAEITKLANP
jgi:hypothetical protein